MQRVSSNLTLFFKFFIPIFWLVFFGSLLVAMFVYEEELLGSINGRKLQLGGIAFFLSGLVLFYFLLFPLKRAEFTADFAYITNYFKTYRYSWDSLELIRESRFGFLTIVTLVLKEPGSFGRQIRFIASNRLYQGFWEEHQALREQLAIED